MEDDMAKQVDLSEMRRLMATGAQVIEVLPAEEYRQAHLPGAISIPLKQLDEPAVKELDLARPVVAYCWDWLCDLSPRAAERLEWLGFTQVYDYKAGKVDWLAHNLPVEGDDAAVPTVGHLARRDVVTAVPGESVGSVSGRVATSPYRFGLVVSGQGVVLGRLRQEALSGDPQALVEQVMEAGPSTLRPNVRADELAEHLRHKGVRYVIVTDPEGQLLGVARRSDLDAAQTSPNNTSG